MWYNSKPTSYNNIRTFILGVKGQSFFPNGVIYEGVDDKPRYYRGETGANDSIIPTVDNLTQLTDEMPNNPLSEILKDFRKYRPAHHNEWLTYV
jgi:indoleamine 2,3-dioxygenase